MEASYHDNRTLSWAWSDFLLWCFMSRGEHGRLFCGEAWMCYRDSSGYGCESLPAALQQCGTGYLLRPSWVALQSCISLWVLSVCIAREVLVFLSGLLVCWESGYLQCFGVLRCPKAWMWRKPCVSVGDFSSQAMGSWFCALDFGYTLQRSSRGFSGWIEKSKGGLTPWAEC